MHCIILKLIPLRPLGIEWKPRKAEQPQKQQQAQCIHVSEITNGYPYPFSNQFWYALDAFGNWGIHSLLMRHICSGENEATMDRRKGRGIHFLFVRHVCIVLSQRGTPTPSQHAKGNQEKLNSNKSRRKRNACISCTLQVDTPAPFGTHFGTVLTLFSAVSIRCLHGVRYPLGVCGVRVCSRCLVRIWVSTRC